MMQGGDKLLLKDFIFSKEVRFGRYSSLSSQPPGAIVATKAGNTIMIVFQIVE